MLCNKAMEIKRKENGHEGLFEAFDGQERMGYISYMWDNGEQMAIEHTVVDPAFGGRGVASKLLDYAADYARENHKKIRAVCSFVVAKFAKSSAYDDVKAEV
mgnify:CR=1 FL=1